jgi:hypothetical protein
MRVQLPFALIAAAFAYSLFAATAHAQRARVFVASYGNDANPCTFGSPARPSSRPSTSWRRAAKLRQ